MMPFRTPPQFNRSYVDVSDLNARWDQIPLQGLGDPKGLAGGVLSSGAMGSIGAPLGAATEEEKELFPWGEFSQHTQNIQIALNVYMDELGYRPISTDGVLGPETCAAMKAVSPGDVVGTCQAFGTLQKKDVATYTDTRDEEEKAVVTEAGMGDTAWIIIGGLVAAGAVGAAIWYKKKKG